MEEKTTKKPTSIAGKIIKNGIIDENPTFRLVLGCAPRWP